MLGVEHTGAAVPESPEAARDDVARSPVMIVCSRRPRVGRTLLARLLVNYFLAYSRQVVAFDANPSDPVLTSILPGHTIPATIADTLGQMALFDRLIFNIGIPKVVDLAPEQLERYLKIMEEIDFVAEARQRGIDTVIFFIAENHPRSIDAYQNILARFPDAMVVPVHNEILGDWTTTSRTHPPRGTMPVRIQKTPTLLHEMLHRPGFSIAEFVNRPSQGPTILHKWIRQPFIAFRDLELRLALPEFAPLFRLVA